MPTEEDFASKVIKSLQNQTVDLSNADFTAQSDPTVYGDIVAFGAPSQADGPLTGGNKDIIIVPGFAGAASTSVSQVNFYWKAPATVDTTGFDTNVRTTIFNFALSTGTAITTPVLAFGGYDGTTNYLPTRNWNAAGTGATAKIWINPFRGEVATDYLQFNSGYGGAGATTTQGSLYYDVTQDKLRFAISTSTTSGFAKTIAFFDDIAVGSVGFAVTARNLMPNAAGTQATHYLLFSPTATASGNAGVAISTAGSGVGLSFDPAANTLVSGKFIANGVIVGSAAQEINTLSGDLKLNGATNNVTVGQDLTVTGNLVVNGTTFTVNTTVTNLEDPIITLSAAGGTQPNFNDTKDRGIAFNYFSGTAKTGFFGRQDTSNNFVFLTDAYVTSSEVFAGNAGTIVAANFIGLATTASQARITAQTTGTFYPMLSNTSTDGGFSTHGTDAQFSFDSANNILTIPTIYSGTAVSSALFTSSSTLALRNGANSTTGIQLQNLGGSSILTVDTVNSRVGINVTPTTALDVSGSMNISGGYNINGNTVLNSNTLGSVITTSSLITVGTISTGVWAGTAITTLYGGTGNLVPFAVGDLLFANSATTLSKLPDVAVGSVLASAGVGATPSYTPISTLSVGIASTAANIAVSDAATSNTNMYLLVGTPRTSTTAAGTAVSTNLNVFYNPSSNLLTTGGLAVTSSSALSAGTYLTIRTHPTDDNSTTDYFIRGLNSDNSTSKFSVDANGNLRATTKSFDIPHPTKPGKRLVYGVLEGPEHGVYHRGTVIGKSPIKVELPEYWDKLVGSDYNVSLTTWGNYNVHIVEKNDKFFTIQLNAISLIAKFKEIKVDYVVHGSRLDAPLNIEQD